MTYKTHRSQREHLGHKPKEKRPNTFNQSKGLGQKIDNRFRLTKKQAEEEYELIRQKKSKLSALERLAVVYYIERQRKQQDGNP